jgi:hypothetical protein
MAFASPGSRLVAYILDLVIQFIAVIVLGILSIVLGVIFFPLAILSALAIVVVSIGYFPYFWARSGQTPGMAQMRSRSSATRMAAVDRPRDPVAHRPDHRYRRLLDSAWI